MKRQREIKQPAPAAAPVVEAMEQRLLLSTTLLGITPEHPLMPFNNQGTTVYEAAADTLKVDATVLDFQTVPGAPASDPPRVFQPSTLAIDVRVDDTGALLGGVAGDDLVVEGTVDMDGDYVPDVSGVLLTGEVLAFGAADSGTSTDGFDFRFEVTGGLLASYYAGRDIGVAMTSEASSYTGDFSVDFSGGAKGNLGAVDVEAQPASLGDFVWHDLYHGPGHLVDGIQDAGEPGFEGVVVNLLDADGNFLADTATDATGYYEFTDLAADTYIVEIDASNFDAAAPLEGYYATLGDAAGNSLDAADSDGDITTHRSHPVVLEAGEHDPTIDFGFFTTGIDLVKEAPEEVVAGEEIVYTFTVENTGDVVLHGGAHVYDPLLNPTGSHEIWGGVLQPGEVHTFTRSYQTTAGVTDIDFDADAFGTPLAAGTVVDTEWAAHGVTVTTHDPADHPAMIFDSANPTGGDWDLGTANEDFGGPGRGRGGEAGRPGANDTPLDNILIISEDADSSDPDDDARGGTLIFTFDSAVDVEAVGVLDIDCGETGGWIRAYDAAGGIISATPIASLGNNSAQTVAVGAENVSLLKVHLDSSGAVTDLLLGGGECSTTVVNEAWAIGCPIGPYGGLPNVRDDASTETDVVCETPAEPAALGDLVWLDADEDGVQDAGEAGVEGVEVTLFDAGDDGEAGTADDVELATQTTDGDGEYFFDGLAAGTYFVQFAQPEGYDFTAADQGDDALDSDADAATGRTAAVTLAAGETNRTVDAGVVAEQGGQGCTPGYWKQSHHLDDWTDYSPNDRFEDVFGVDARCNWTLLEALKAGGGGEAALARHAVAALLNAAHPEIDYAYDADEVIAMVQHAYATGEFQSAKNALEQQNESGCELGGGGCKDKGDRHRKRWRKKWQKRHGRKHNHRKSKRGWSRGGDKDDGDHDRKSKCGWNWAKRAHGDDDDGDDDDRRGRKLRRGRFDVLSFAKALRRFGRGRRC